MGSVNHPKLYDPATMASIKAAFYEVWMALETQRAVDGTEDAELKAAIIRRLIDLAANGTVHPEEMKAEVLEESAARLASPSSSDDQSGTGSMHSSVSFLTLLTARLTA